MSAPSITSFRRRCARKGSLSAAASLPCSTSPGDGPVASGARFARAGIVALAALAALVFTTSCLVGPRAAISPVPLPPAPESKPLAALAEADALFAKADYLALTKALALYGEVLDAPGWREAAAEKFVRTAVLVKLREKTLGIRCGEPLGRAAKLISSDSRLAAYAPVPEFLTYVPCDIKGNAGEGFAPSPAVDGYFDWVDANVPRLDEEFAARASGDDFFACLRLALRRAFSYRFKDKLEPWRSTALDRPSRLTAFSEATSPKPDADRIAALLAENPEFYELHFFLGELAIEQGKLLTAERHYREVEDHIPGSPSVLISLAQVAFHLEEFESCLEYDDRALALVPAYRDALLGKALALGYLGRFDEAIAVLERMLELGTYYMGEARYWTAWNLNELGRLEEARRSIDAAKLLIFGQAEVTTLSGIIAYKMGRLDDAERDLRESLRIQPDDADAAFHLGKLYADRQEWLASGTYFSGAAGSYEKKEAGVRERIGEIEASDLAPDRKDRFLKRMNLKIRMAEVTRATCDYNAAAGFFNAGRPAEALELAKRAAAHPAFADKAAALLKRLGVGPQ